MCWIPYSVRFLNLKKGQIIEVKFTTTSDDRVSTNMVYDNMQSNNVTKSEIIMTSF